MIGIDAELGPEDAEESPHAAGTCSVAVTINNKKLARALGGSGPTPHRLIYQHPDFPIEQRQLDNMRFGATSLFATLGIGHRLNGRRSDDDLIQSNATSC